MSNGRRFRRSKSTMRQSVVVTDCPGCSLCDLLGITIPIARFDGGNDGSTKRETPASQPRSLSIKPQLRLGADQHGTR
jgi:hypothetical protein